MNRAHALALLAAALVAIPAGYGAVQVAPHLLAQDSPPPQADGTGGDVLKEWQGDVPAGVARGQLQIAVYEGNVHVQGWAQDAYDVQLLKAQNDPNGVTLGTSDIVPTFNASVQDGAFALQLTVQHKGNSVRVNQPDDIAVVAKVPARLAWGLASVCSGASYGMGTMGMQPPAVMGCAQQDPSLSLQANVGGLVGSNSSGLKVPFLVEGLHGGQLTLTADNANVAAARVEFTNASLMASNGNARFAGDAGMLAMATDNGNADASLTNRANAKASITSSNGNVAVHVPVAQGRGYDVRARSNNGNVVINLPDMVQDNGTGADASPSSQPAPLLPPLPLGAPSPPPSQSSDPSQQSVHAHSADLAQDSVVTTLDLATDSGNVVVDPLNATAPAS